MVGNRVSQASGLPWDHHFGIRFQNSEQVVVLLGGGHTNIGNLGCASSLVQKDVARLHPEKHVISNFQENVLVMPFLKPSPIPHKTRRNLDTECSPSVLIVALNFLIG
jgi:hypothetical protein